MVTILYDNYIPHCSIALHLQHSAGSSVHWTEHKLVLTIHVLSMLIIVHFLRHIIT